MRELSRAISLVFVYTPRLVLLAPCHRAASLTVLYHPLSSLYAGLSFPSDVKEGERGREFSLRALTLLSYRRKSHFLSTSETRAHVVGPRNPATRKFYRRPTDGCCSTNRKLYDGELICARESAIPRCETSVVCRGNVTVFRVRRCARLLICGT